MQICLAIEWSQNSVLYVCLHWNRTDFPVVFWCVHVTRRHSDPEVHGTWPFCRGGLIIGFHCWLPLKKIYLEVYGPFLTHRKDFIISNKCLINQFKLPKQQYLKSVLRSPPAIMTPTLWPINLSPDPWPDASVNIPICMWSLPFFAFFLFVCVYFNISRTLFSFLVG